MRKQHILVAGAGFSGCTFARIAAEAGHPVLVIDKREHTGGNAHDRLDEHGVLVHPYGPHIFHTNSLRVIQFLSRFTEWRFYEHRVLAQVEGSLYSIPINRTTLNRLYGLDLDEAGAKAYLERVREPREPIRTSEDTVLNSVGLDLCEKFFRGYTRKQWGLDLSELSASVASRIPTRTTDDDRYFEDTYQLMPAAGYSKLFESMLDHPNIQVKTATDFFDISPSYPESHVVFTGPIDAYFNFVYGPLPYRSLRFQHHHIPTQDRYQVVGTVNFPNDHAYTRITEFKHLTGQRCQGTSIVQEYPTSEGDPYYPVPRTENDALYRRYAELAERETRTTFIGRLAQYRYYNMDQVVAAAMKQATDFVMARTE